MASSPSIAATSSIAPVKAPAKPGLYAKMMRLWLEHNHRLAQLGILSF